MTFDHVQFVRAIDGDTVVINIPRLPAIFGHCVSIRLAGIQSPEIRSKDKDTFHRAMKAKQFLQTKCEKAEKITLCNCKRGKYFRIIADLFIDGLCVNSELVRAGLAVKKQF